MILDEFFTPFDLTPISSMIMSFLRLFFLLFGHKRKWNKPYIYYFFINCFVQILIFLFYGLLLLLIELGKLKKLKLKIKKCFTKNDGFIINDYKDMNKDYQNKFEQNLETNYIVENEIQFSSSKLNINDSLIINTNEDNQYNKNSNKEGNAINPFIVNEINNVKNSGNLNTKIEGLIVKYRIGFCKNIKAVNNLYLNLEINEKFGLLGYNGSGKTTIFKAITNEILHDFGKIYLFGYDNYEDFNKIRRKIGYCPQENPLFDFMKVKEIIKFYLELKTLEDNVEYICKKFGLEKYLDTYCKNLSGGNKRKLTLAIALMNKPNLLLLDEPSTGVDPLSKRIMWKNINELSKGEHFNMILTTHSMEEAEILCDRVSWLKDGNFICLGNSEELKLQYGKGYLLHIKFDDSIINSNESISNKNIEEIYNDLANLVDINGNYSDFILNNKEIEAFIIALLNAINIIKPYTSKIELNEIRKDFSFELVICILENEKKNLFSEIINLKNNKKGISEMIISLERLENILLSFK